MGIITMLFLNLKEGNDDQLKPIHEKIASFHAL